MLPKASCAKCAAITAKVEQFVLRQIFGTMRVKNGFKITENRSSIDLLVYQRGRGVQIKQEKPSLYPYVILGMDLPMPGVLVNRPIGEEPVGDVVIVPDEIALAALGSAGTPAVFDRRALDIDMLARMLAKIALAHLYSKGIRLATPYLPGIVTGNTSPEAYSHFIGGYFGEANVRLPTEPGVLHQIWDWAIETDGGLILHLVRIRLFADVPNDLSPDYLVVAGEH
ncbi:hypothetical protein [Sphingomonas sp. Ag1]|uniref:hypothetical protein n=1 Tax=Sphingomonas sp. Ag1 TaxID=1642949 RepID=UPI0012E02CA6|nr:hypothetical protein [Sphingomonas sp. Ag1]